MTAKKKFRYKDGKFFYVLRFMDGINIVDGNYPFDIARTGYNDDLSSRYHRQAH